jgi:tetratricopeptide (TPR) repeat protein
MSEMNHELIEQYLDGELTGEALLAFEKEMQASAELSNEVRLHKIVRDDMMQSIQGRRKEHALAETLDDLGRSHFKKKPAKIVGIDRRWWYAAAAIAASVAIFLIIKPFSSQPFNNEKLFTEYVRDEESLPEAQRGNNNNDSALIEATRLYNKKAYDSALPLLRFITSQKPGETQLVFAKGRAFLQTGIYDSALMIFDNISTGTSVFKNQALWSKALVLLKQNKLNECYDVLTGIPRDSDKYTEAQKLMKKISREIKKNK